MAIVETLAALGFVVEGGGAAPPYMVRYLAHGAAVIASQEDGPGLPDADSWLICAYPRADWEADFPEAVLCIGTDAMSADKWPAALAAALAFAAVLDMRQDAPADTLAGLTAEYIPWLDANGLPHRCALELQEEDNLTAPQRAWLQSFSARWEAAARAEDAKRGA